jgi:hypothetical protein
MKELRLTFKTADFGEISQVLIDRGISFQVEPVDQAAPRPAPVRQKPPAARKSKKTKKKTARKPARESATESLPLAGAERLREALGQPRPASTPPPPGDKSD